MNLVRTLSPIVLGAWIAFAADLPAAESVSAGSGANEKPKGYKNNDEVKMAVLTGQVKLIHS